MGMSNWLHYRCGLFPLLIAAIVAIGGCTRVDPAPLDSRSVEKRLTPPPVGELKVAVANVHHPLLRPVELHPEEGLSPDEAAVIAVIINPSLRVQRDRREAAQAALLAAGILPNPQLSASYDWVTGGNTVDTVNAYGLGL